MCVSMLNFYFFYLIETHGVYFLNDSQPSSTQDFGSSSLLAETSTKNVFWGRAGYHILSSSCWPIFLAVCLSGFFFSLACFLNSIFSLSSPIIWLILTLTTVHFWGIELLHENLYGYHTLNEYENIKLTFLLFLTSEALLFFSFFWAYLYYAISPPVTVGAVWAYFEEIPFNSFGIPLLNTALLVISGFFATHSLRQLTVYNFNAAYEALVCSFFLGLLFLFFQWVEYATLSFNIYSGVFGSLFYLLTGFHGFHVLIGLYLLSWSITRLLNEFTQADNFLGFELTVLYWHFVDIIWLALYAIVYLWT